MQLRKEQKLKEECRDRKTKVATSQQRVEGCKRLEPMSRQHRDVMTSGNTRSRMQYQEMMS